MRLALFSLLAASASAQPLPPGTRYAPGVDVTRYGVAVTLSDATDRIEARTLIEFTATSDTTTVLPLDLVSLRPDGTGMRVSAVIVDGAQARFSHTADRLIVGLPRASVGPHTATVAYGGVPADGLIIGTNRYGERTFFGDHWPNRARNWLPVVDHPSDKALFDWTVTAPAHYQIVAGGRLAEETDHDDGTRTTRYVSDGHALAAKVAVIGAARFAVEHREPVHAGGRTVQTETWAYPTDRGAGFTDFAVADSAVAVLSRLVGPFPYARLANVESTTRYGGMENAGAIFYDENGVTGNGDNAGTVVHEVAHQWFGDLVSESDWPHLWLSEGFATYLTHVYSEQTRGTEALRQGLARDRDRIVAFAAANPQRMLVDTTFTDPLELLNAYSYQRGSWTLHMLRARVGDDAFWTGLRLYLARHADGNATTDDLQAALEETSGGDLTAFFQQWTRRPGVPRIDAAWTQAGDVVTVTLRQTGAPYSLPLDVQVASAGGATTVVRASVAGNETVVRVPVQGRATGLVLDPNTEALADLSVSP